jgi:hypothetical protein
MAQPLFVAFQRCAVQVVDRRVDRGFPLGVVGFLAGPVITVGGPFEVASDVARQATPR